MNQSVIMIHVKTLFTDQIYNSFDQMNNSPILLQLCIVFVQDKYVV